MAFARVNGVVIHYRDEGRADLPTVVFSNSLGTDFRIWDDVVNGLGGRYRVVRYDKRGHGLSEATPAPYTLSDHVGDLAALLDHLGVKRAVIVGLSVGGMIAQALAAARPELVAGLVLSNTAHRIGTDELWNDRIRIVTTEGIGAMADAIMQRWFSPSYRTPDNPAFVAYRNMLVRTTVDGYAGTCAALRDADLTESTRALAIPVLCIAGDHDGSTPPDLVRSTADLVKGSDYRIIEGTGHLPCIEKPEAVAALVSGFLRGVKFG
jgi:3-oxoadipate enol-lactonase